MPISKIIMKNISDLRNKSCREITVKPSKQSWKLQPKSEKLSAVSRGHISESQTTYNLSAKSRISHIYRRETVVSDIPMHLIISESQRSLSESDAANESGKNFINTRKNVGKMKGRHPAKHASNKQVLINNNMPITSNNSLPATKDDASNDGRYGTAISPTTNVVPLQGTLLQNDNTNLPMNTAVKATVKVDGLSATLAIEELSQQADILKAAKDMCKAGKDGLHLTKLYVKQGGRYKYRYAICFGKNKLGVLSLAPTQKRIRFIHLDFNPSNIGSKGCQRVAQTIRTLVGANATEVIKQANITSLHIAIDLYGIDINSFLYFAVGFSDSSIWGKMFKSGKQVEYRLQSQYVGSISSRLLKKTHIFPLTHPPKKFFWSILNL